MFNNKYVRQDSIENIAGLLKNSPNQQLKIFLKRQIKHKFFYQKTISSNKTFKTNNKQQQKKSIRNKSITFAKTKQNHCTKKTKSLFYLSPSSYSFSTLHILILLMLMLSKNINSLKCYENEEVD